MTPRRVAKNIFNFRNPNEYQLKNISNKKNSEKLITKTLLNQNLRTNSSFYQKNCHISSLQKFNNKINSNYFYNKSKLKNDYQKMRKILPIFLNTTKKLNLSEKTNSSENLSKNLLYFEANQMLRREASLDLSALEHRQFILVSFGSLAKVEFMDVEILWRFFDAFKNVPYLILWQTNSKQEKIFNIISKELVPANVYLMNWAPIQILLGLFLFKTLDLKSSKTL